MASYGSTKSPSNCCHPVEIDTEGNTYCAAEGKERIKRKFQPNLTMSSGSSFPRNPLEDKKGIPGNTVLGVMAQQPIQLFAFIRSEGAIQIIRRSMGIEKQDL